MSLTIALAGRERRILFIDDNQAIHDDYKKSLGILGGTTDTAQALADVEADLFGDAPKTVSNSEFEGVSALQGADALRLIEDAQKCGRPFALAFVDMRMPPGWDGLETIERLWEVAPDLQCVICTAYSDYSWEDLVARLGKRDNLLLLRKPFDRTEIVQIATAMTEKWALGRAAQMRLEELESIVAERTDQLRAAADLDHERVRQLEQRAIELRYAAMTDKLTGLPNRALFNERLSQAVHARRIDPDRHFAVLFLDFDRFKLINDSLGHDVGDKLLIAVAHRIVSTLRVGDTVVQGDPTAFPGDVPARLGGDEFVVLLSDLVDFDDATRVAERILEALKPAFEIDGHAIHCSASIGVTTSHLDYQSAEDIMRDADTAMYRAKATGRSRVVVFDPVMHQEVVEKMTLETTLRAAMSRDEFDIHFQPIIRIADGTLVGFEALARWRGSDGTWLSPANFIPIAEESGLIVELGETIMRKAFTVAAEWRKSFGEKTPYISVNLSPKQLMETRILGRIDDALEATGAKPGDIALELTESYLMCDTDGAVAKLRSIRDRGFGLLIDDFGTGYSSLSSLHRYPFTGMKIDRSFLLNSESVRNYASVLDAMVVLAKNLGIAVIAEGVENTRQLALLESVRCGYAQGFFFATPLIRSAAERAITEGLPNALIRT